LTRTDEIYMAVAGLPTKAVAGKGDKVGTDVLITVGGVCFVLFDAVFDQFGVLIEP